MSLEFLLLVTLLAFLVLIGSKIGFVGARNLPPGVRLAIESGTPFIFIGAVVGPQGLNLLSADMLNELGAVLVLGFGWIGFLYGSHFEARRMKRFPLRLYLAGAAESLVTLLFAGLAAWVAMGWLREPIASPLRLVGATVLGACAAGTAPSGVFILASTGYLSRRVMQALRFFAAIDDVPAVIVLGVLFAVYPVSGSGTLGPWERVVLGIGIGLLLGAGTHWLLPRTGDVRHNSLILLGMAALGAGSAALLRLSALFVSIIGGVVFANLFPRKEDVYGLMASREHTLYAVFLLIAGSMFNFRSLPMLWVIVPVYVIARALGKLGGTALGRQLFLRDARFSPRVGAGLLSQGGMPLVFAVHFEHALGLSSQAMVMTIFVLAVLVNDLLAMPLAIAALRREG